MAHSGQAGREEARRSGRLERFLGDALIGAMVLLGLMFCVGAARANVSTASSDHRDAFFTAMDSVKDSVGDYYIRNERIVTIYS